MEIQRENIDVVPLGTDTRLAAIIAGLQFSLWGPLTGYNSAAEYERFLGLAAGASKLPAVLVASHKAGFVGSVNLLEHELSDYPHLTPWMSQLFVIENERGRGVGRILVEAAVAHAAKLGYRRLHLFTSGTLPSYYRSLGWTPIETFEYLGKLRTVMARYW